jgi:predicted MPP superfamily phosphohydrolase
MNSKKIAFQVLSDLHLEKFAEFVHKHPRSYTRPIQPMSQTLIREKLLCPDRWIYTHPKTADYLILVGDIGNPHITNYHHYFDYCSPLYKQVFVISGNHEYYFPYDFSPSKYVDIDWIKRVEDKITEITRKYPNVHFLQNNHKVITIGGDTTQKIAIHGSTLWSPINKTIGINSYDFHKIPHWSWVLRNDLYDTHKKGIKEFVQNRELRKIPKIMLTHHLPSSTLVMPSMYSNPYSTLFYSNIWEELQINVNLEKYAQSIIGWFYGHTHQSSRDLREYAKARKEDINPIFHANPMGNIEKKSFEEIKETLSMNHVIEIDNKLNQFIEGL